MIAKDFFIYLFIMAGITYLIRKKSAYGRNFCLRCSSCY